MKRITRLTAALGGLLATTALAASPTQFTGKSHQFSGQLADGEKNFANLINHYAEGRPEHTAH
jgi:hypothetical protein